MNGCLDRRCILPVYFNLLMNPVFILLKVMHEDMASIMMKLNMNDKRCEDIYVVGCDFMVLIM